MRLVCVIDLMCVERGMRPSGSLPGTENRESLGLVTSTRGQRSSLVSTNEKRSWSKAISRYLHNTITSKPHTSMMLSTDTINGKAPFIVPYIMMPPL